MKARSNSSNWHRLDNSANVFPLISHKTFSNVYRLAVQLNEDVDPELLQKALDVTLPQFGNFNFRIRRGFFWYYFETTEERALVQEEALRPCFYIDTRSRHHHLFRVVYYKRRISLEAFHAIADGTGALNFLKTLIINYLKLVEGEVFSDYSPRIKVNTELEDSYKKHYKKVPFDESKLSKAYRLRGKLLPVNTMGVIHGYLNLPELSAYSKSKGVTLTEYVTTVYLWSIYKDAISRGKSKRPVHLSVPVNLRKFFESTTNMNFFGHITIEALTTNPDLTFDEMLMSVKKQFKDQVTEENMQRYISKNVSMRNNILTRAIPLPIKNLAVRIIHIKSIQSYTSTLTNVGKFEVDAPYSSKLSHIEVLVNTSRMDPLKCGVCAYGDKFVVTLTSQLEDVSIQKTFFKKLTDDGLHVAIESNGAFYEIL
ncbi:MAG TPA: hypothetical protein DCS67_12090 [Clostridiales bacterium UBA8960]|jgi:NRPS condensation-like uncharacterized protein|nr:hypothetical protein [Clostridiales bacterium UBA8960]